MNQNKGASIWSKDFICVFIAQFMASMGYNFCTAYMASYSYFIGSTAVVVGFITGMINGVAVLLRPLAGPMQMKYDGRKLLALAFLVGAGSCVGYAISGSPALLILFRFIGGFQISLGIPLALSLASDCLPIEKMTSGLAIFGIAGTLASAVGVVFAENLMDFLVAQFAQAMAYKVFFLLSGLVFAIGLIPIFFLSPKPVAPEVKENHEPWYNTIFMMEGLIPCIMALLIFAANRLPGNYLMLYKEELGLSSVSSFFVVQAVAMIVSKLFTGRWMDKYGADKLYIPFALIFALGLFVLGAARNIPMLLFSSVLIAVGFGAVQPAIQAICIHIAPPEKRGVACSTSQLGVDTGCFVGPMTLGGIVYPIVGSYSRMYMFSTVPVLISCVLLIFFVRKHGFIKKGKK